MLKITQLPQHEDLRPQKTAGCELPHASIEINSVCNIRCKACYNIDRPRQKPLDEIQAEIDWVQTQRRLDTISLVGGEPTVHPQLPEIVSYVKKQGLHCQILTNGVAFLRDPDDRLLRKLKRAGVDRILVHIDQGQCHVHDDLDAARRAVFSKLEEQQVFFDLSVTLMAGDEETVPSILRAYSGYRFFEGVFVTMARDMATAFDPDRNPAADPDLARVHRSLERDLQVQPTAYVPSNLDDDAISWLMYFFYRNTKTGETFALSPRFNRGFRRLYRWLRGRNFFGETAQPARFVSSLAITAVAELILEPGRWRELYRLLETASASALRFQYVVIQEPPRYNAEHGQVELCYACPDATPREGRLMPVCAASWLSPPEGGTPRAPRQAILDIEHHLAATRGAAEAQEEARCG